MEIKYLCKIPFFDETSRHQQWSKSKASWLILHKGKVIVFFENNQTYEVNRNTKTSLEDGKYRCIP